MKREVAENWIEALRSGKYKQTTGFLKDSEGYCCLGVLCEVSGKEYSGGGAVLPIYVQKWAGLKSDNGRLFLEEDYDFFDTYGSLDRLNDNTDMSFDEIADIIQITWEEL